MIAARSKRLRLTGRECGLIGDALAEPRRWQILRQISKSANPVPRNTLQKTQPISAATLSYHLRELQNAGLIEIRREGNFASLVLRRDVLHAYVQHLVAMYTKNVSCPVTPSTDGGE